MTTKTSHTARRTTMVPVTTMEELPVLNDAERAELITSLKEAEARLDAGEGTDFAPGAFSTRLKALYRERNS